jgi:hypothetical protein
MAIPGGSATSYMPNGNPYSLDQYTRDYGPGGWGGFSLGGNDPLGGIKANPMGVADDVFKVIPGLLNDPDYRGDLGAAAEAERQKGVSKGGIIGLGLGAALAPLTGGASLAILPKLGQAIGGLFGGNKGQRIAEDIYDNRQAKKENFRSLYRDAAREANISNAAMQGRMKMADMV